MTVAPALGVALPPFLHAAGGVVAAAVFSTAYKRALTQLLEPRAILWSNLDAGCQSVVDLGVLVRHKHGCWFARLLRRPETLKCGCHLSLHQHWYRHHLQCCHPWGCHRISQLICSRKDQWGDSQGHSIEGEGQHPLNMRS